MHSLTHADASQACAEREPARALAHQLQEARGGQKGKPLTQRPGSRQWACLLAPEDASKGPQQLAAAGAALRLAQQLDWQAPQRVGCQRAHRW